MPKQTGKNTRGALGSKISVPGIILIILVVLAIITRVRKDKTVDLADVSDISGLSGRISIDFQTAEELMEKQDRALLIDVRSPGEYAEQHVPGSVNFPLDTIEEDITEITKGEDEAYIPIVYCRSGARSKKAAGKLLNLGYPLVFDAGGIMSYNGAKPLEP